MVQIWLPHVNSNQFFTESEPTDVGAYQPKYADNATYLIDATLLANANKCGARAGRFTSSSIIQPYPYRSFVALA